MDRERFQFDRQVRQMAGVLTVVDDQPRPGGVTLRVVAGHGDRIRSAALAIAPPGLELYVLEDDLVTTVPELPAPDPGAWSAGGPRGDDVGVAPGRDATLCCSYVFCRHRTAPSEFGLAAGDRCRQKIRVDDGWMACPGRYEALPPARRRWWGRRR